MRRLLIIPLLFSISGCATQDSGSYSLLQGQSEAGRAAQLSKRARTDLQKLRRSNKELEATVVKLQALNNIHKDKLVQCEAAVKKLGVKVSPR